MPIEGAMSKRYDRPLTTGEIARACHVTVPSVKNWIKQGKLQAYRTPGGHFRVTAAEFRRFRETHDFPRDTDGPLRILVVDDQPQLVDFVLDVLRATGGPLKLEAASNGYEGLLKVGGFRPHLLLLDLKMPGLDGFEVCRRIKADPATTATRIVAMTGFPGEFQRAAALKAGADVYVEKTGRIADLEAVLVREIEALRR